MLACTRNNLEIIKFLIEQKANLDQVNKDGWNAFLIAIREGHLNIIDYLMKVNETLVLKTRSKNGRTPLHTACLHGHLEIVRLILEKMVSKSNEMLKLKDSCGSSPFMEAVTGGHINIVRFLIEKYDVDINDRDNLENSCLHLSAQSGSEKCFKFLFELYFIKHKSHDVNQVNSNLIDQFARNVNKYKMTVLHSAVKNDRTSIVEKILESFTKNANFESSNELKVKLNCLLNQKDSSNRSALDIAKSAKSTSILNLFNKI